MSFSERILASAWPLDTVPKAVLSWHSCGYAAAYAIGASGTLGRGPMTGSSDLGEGTGDSGGSWVRGGGCMWQRAGFVGVCTAGIVQRRGHRHCPPLLGLGSLGKDTDGAIPGLC